MRRFALRLIHVESASYRHPVTYRVAATAGRDPRGRLIPVGTLHAYLDPSVKTLCGLMIGEDLVAFERTRWSARPVSPHTCRRCATMIR